MDWNKHNNRVSWHHFFRSCAIIEFRFDSVECDAKLRGFVAGTIILGKLYLGRVALLACMIAVLAVLG